MPSLITAPIGTQALYLRSGYWSWLGMLPRSFNLVPTGIGVQPINRTLVYDYDGFSGLIGAGTDINGITSAGRLLVDRVLQDIGSKFNIGFRHALSTEQIENVDLFFKDNSGANFSDSTILASGNTNFAPNHRYIDYSWVNLNPNWYTESTTNNGYVYHALYQKVLQAIGLGSAGNYTGSANYIAVSETATINNNIYINDSWEMSMMSSFSQLDNISLPGISVDFLITMMAADVDALRAYYGTGAAFAGNTTYGVKTNIPASTNYILANLRTFAGTNAFCIVDDGGSDTVDFSNFSVDQRLDLTVRGVNDTSNFGNTTSDIGGLVRNMTLAAGTLIENAILGSGNDRITGNYVNNVLVGGAGNDSILGQEGDDTLDGGSGVDTMEGGLGNDVFFLHNIGDVAIEAADAGTDRVESSITYALGANLENLMLIGFSDINAIGNIQNNTITGNTFNNILDGGTGADTLKGGLGDDTYIVDNIGDVLMELQGQGLDRVQSSVTYSLGSFDIEELTLTGDAPINGTGSRLHNLVVGNTANNILDGREGLDTLVGGLGDDTYIVDNPGDVVRELHGSGIDLIISDVTYALPDDVESLRLSSAAGDSKAIGNILANLITGNSGFNILDGSLGSDTMEGGLGDDIYIVDNVGDVIIETAADGTDSAQSSVSYILSSYVENLTLTGSQAINGFGNNSNNFIVGNSSNNILNGRGGGDRLSGLAGADTFVFQFGESRGNNAGTLFDTITDFEIGFDQIDLLSSIGGAMTAPSIFWRSADNSAASTISSLATAVFADADSLTGGSQPLGLNAATLVSSTNQYIAGNYIFVNDGVAGFQWQSDLFFRVNLASGSLPDVGVISADSLAKWFIGNEFPGSAVIEPISSVTNHIESSTTYTLDANLPNLTLIGFSDDNGIGNALNNVITGNTFNNILDGLTGADTLAGGLGDDTYIVDHLGDVVRELQGQGFDRVQSSVTYSLGACDVEDLILTGDSPINGSGNRLHNVITGNNANNTLEGRGGLDTLVGGLGDDIYIVDNPGDVVREFEGSGTDLIISDVTYALPGNVENLRLSTKAHSSKGTGNILNNYITGNGGANILDGSFGADTMEGFTGNDIYIVDNENDIVIEIENGDSDLVLSSVNFTLPFEVDNLTLTGNAPINGTGNNRNNDIVGNSNNNVLNGGFRADRLTGLSGADIFVFQYGESSGNDSGNLFDTITDFEIGIDRIDLLTSTGAAMTAPSIFWRAADNSSASTISSLANAVYIDVDSLTGGSQPLGLNTAALVSSTNPYISGNYIFVNDGVPGFQWQSDLFFRVNLASGSLPDVGLIPSGSLSSWFI
jgi:hypothetical protein